MEEKNVPVQKREDQRETVGKISSELLKKATEDKHTAKDQTAEQLSDYENNIDIAVTNGIKEFGLDRDFYVVVLTKKERLLQNVIRNYFLTRTTCPTPDYDQTVYKYHHESGYIEYLWTVPNKETCINMKTYALQVPPEQKELLNFVLSFYDGTLLKKAQQLNNEQTQADMVII